MNRIATMAIAATAVAGIAGGTVAATSRIGLDGSSASPDGSGGSGSTGTGTTALEPEEAPLFYMSARKIVDGSTEVPVRGVTIDNVRSLERVSGGWFVVSGTSPQEPAFRGTYVASNGATTDIGKFFGQWDVDAEGDSVVAMFGDVYQVRDLTTGEVTDEIQGVEGAESALGDAAFSGNDIVASWRDKDENRLVVGVDPDTGEQYELSNSILNFTTSPDGRRIAGEQVRGHEAEGDTCFAGGPVRGAEGDKSWETCDWRSNALRPQFSPDGTRLLAVPYDTEGFGPTAIGVLDAATGQAAERFDVPEATTDAAWGDETTLFTHGYQDFEMTGGVIYRCTLGGDCTLEVDSKRPIVLGTA